MLDIKYIEENESRVRDMLAARGVDFPLDAFLTQSRRRRELISTVEAKRAAQNAISRRISELNRIIKQKESDLKGVGFKTWVEEENEQVRLRDESDSIKKEIRDLENELSRIEYELRVAILYLPNIPYVSEKDPEESVPVGQSEAYNRERHRWGEPRKFDFSPRPHWEMGEMLGIMDQERAVKVAGARFAMTVGAGARLERALQNFMLEEARKRGYIEVNVPYMVNTAAMEGTGQLPKFRDDMYSVVDPFWFNMAQALRNTEPQTDTFTSLAEQIERLSLEAMWLVPTAEVPVTNLHRDEMLAAAELPKKYAAFTPCFRREAGAPGRDTRGMIRVHQFLKVELVKIVLPDNSYDELESLVRDAANVLELLELPYREVVLSTGDLGFGAAKCVDLEVWLPSENKYREISSCSNYEAFQARRMNTRFRRAKGAKPEFVHTLNGSGLAVGRTLVAIMENYQNKDGTITVPAALRPYLGGSIIKDAHTIE